MLAYLAYLSIFAAFASGSIFAWYLSRRGYSEVKKYATVGAFAAIFNFIVEYIGTSTGSWTYYHSVFFTLDLVPVELTVLFFGMGVGARFAWLQLKERDTSFDPEKILYVLMAAAFTYYLTGFYRGGVSLLPFAAVFGLWGICNISKENRGLSLTLAVAAFATDLVVEILVIGSGGYSYTYGFSLPVPVTYSLMTLGLIGVIEKLE